MNVVFILTSIAVMHPQPASDRCNYLGRMHRRAMRASGGENGCSSGIPRICLKTTTAKTTSCLFLLAGRLLSRACRIRKTPWTEASRHVMRFCKNYSVIFRRTRSNSRLTSLRYPGILPVRECAVVRIRRQRDVLSSEVHVQRRLPDPAGYMGGSICRR